MRFLIILLVSGILTLPVFGQDIVFAASDIARTLALEMREQGKKNIAVSTFRDLKGETTAVGAFFAEELYTQLVTTKKAGVVIVERSRTDAVFDEQRLGIDGLRESGKLDAFVKILEVDSLIVGTISTIPELGGRMRINARLIAIPSGEALASASAFAIVESIPPQSPVSPPPTQKLGPIATHELKNVSYELMGCTKEGSLISCHLILTNNGADKQLTICMGYCGKSFLYDQRGHYFEPNRVVIADVDSSSNQVKKFLIADIPTSMKIFFEGVPSAIEFIKILHITTGDGAFEFRNVQFSK